MKWALLASLAVSWIFISQSFADDLTESEIPLDSSGIVNVQMENDLWGSGRDSHYTHGTRFSYLSAERLTDFEGLLKSKVLDALPEFLRPDTNRISFVLGQNIFTPDDITKFDLIENDRPYAGWLYTGVGFVAEKKTGGRPFLDSLEINIGVVGPAAFGEETQTHVHRLIDSPLPEGWNNQLENEPGLVIFYERKWPLRPEFSLNPVPSFSWTNIELDFTPSTGFALGNVYTYFAAGTTLRIGNDLPNDYGPPRVRPGLSGSGFFKPQNKFTWYIFGGIEGRAMGRNIFLDGNTFEDSHSVDKKTLVGDLQVGLVITMFGNYRLAFTNVFRTKEFDGQIEADEFGSINFSFRW